MTKSAVLKMKVLRARNAAYNTACDIESEKGNPTVAEMYARKLAIVDALDAVILAMRGDDTQLQLI